MSPAKLSRLKKSWAHKYQQHALPLIDEEPFARFFHQDNGRPNKSIRLVLSGLILKEYFDLTDEEALEQLEWNAAWHYALEEYTFNADGTHMERCAGGVEPIKQWTNRHRKVRAYFAHEHCNQHALSSPKGCPLRDRCRAKKKSRGRVIAFHPAKVAMARRRAEQQTSAFKERHKIRSGIEATNSELKRCHGMRKLRVRGRPRVELAVRFKVLALNIKRWCKHLEHVDGIPEQACACMC